MKSQQSYARLHRCYHTSTLAVGINATVIHDESNPCSQFTGSIASAGSKPRCSPEGSCHSRTCVYKGGWLSTAVVHMILLIIG